MNVRIPIAALCGALILVTTGCSSSEASILTTCAQCGVIRSIDSRTAWGEPPPESAVEGAIIGHPISQAGMFGRTGTHTFYAVRIRMDRGGARDVMLGSCGELHVGQRVEIRDGRLEQI